ncbi:MAG: lamin tail domain-containing protein [Verrucomicrobiae bacterium]|nr:lamin tail domain-containing protein [Verrucomicrobiae bacterium]
MSRILRFLAPACAGLMTLLPATGQLVINEFLASNNRGLQDEEGDRPDWIEIHNPGTTPVNLLGWTLTDNASVTEKWTFPATNIHAGGYLVVFASGKDRRVAGAPLHTGFSLSADGEYLGLFRPEGVVAASEYAPEFPPQKADISYGLQQGQERYFDPPTPGAANGSGFADFVADTKFSHDRGFYDRPFDLVITCATPDAAIRYTTNGTPPTATTGLVYDGPIAIPGTRVIRAAAFKTGLRPSNVDTQTYLFPSDIFQQSPNGQAPPGWPTRWGGNVVDYGMDPDVVNSPLYQDELLPALKSLPSFVVVTELRHLFDSSTGIYANPGQDGRDWERPASLELLHPDGREGFQINCGIRVRGGFSRSTSNPKHALRFFFRNEYGAGKLRYPLFGDAGADTFDNMDLRTFQNYSWSFQGDSRGVFVRDQFNRDAQLEMGHQAERGDFYHLFINGQYWGIFNTCERPEASYGETYYGGRKEDFDVIKVEAGPYTINATDGNLDAWNELYNLCRAGITNDAVYLKLQGMNPDGTPNPAYRNLLDVDNLIDYMLVIFYGGNLDAPISNFLGNTSPNNFYGVRDRTGRSGGFKYFVHDAEHTLLDLGENRTGPFASGSSSVSKSNPQYFFQRLAVNPEFRMRLADRIHRHFFNEGALTPSAGQARFSRRTNEIFSAVVLESARWGDAKRATPFTRNREWLSEASRIQRSYLPQRTARVLAQFQAKGWYPAVAAPSFSQHGGPFDPGSPITITAPDGTLYYTADGTDPRAPGGAVSDGARRYAGPLALAESATLKARVLGANGTWSALTEADFLLHQTWQDVLITEIMYHPPSTSWAESDDLEFLELKNVGSEERDLGGMAFTRGIRFTFPRGFHLAPGAFVVLVSNAEAFARAHPDVPIGGVYSGRLSNAGERLSWLHATGGTAFDITYGDRPPWPAAADGTGFSLVPRNPSANPDPSDSAHWRASTRPGGSPGADDPVLEVPAVLITELLAHTDSPDVDAVELHNPGATDADISGWYLTDDRREPGKYRLPASSVIPPGGYLVLTEREFNAPGAPGRFSFNSHGEAVYLYSADATGTLTGYSDGFAFGASANGETFGRHTNSVGDLQFPPQSEPTLGGLNAGPRIGPVVINEIQYDPAPGDVEFVELLNLTDEEIPLFHPQHPENTWQLSGAGFVFPPGSVLPARGFAVATSGDPTLFRLKWQVPDAVPVFGPYAGNLANTGERLELRRPDAPDFETNALGEVTAIIPMLTVDRVRYSHREPWPTGASGTGASLERISPGLYGDDPASWRTSAAGPSPGMDNAVNRAPIPYAGLDQDLVGTVFPLATTLSATATDDGQPGLGLRFRWRQVGGPVGVLFSATDIPDPGIRLPGQGSYLFRVTVSDGEREASDDVAITVRRTTGDVVLLPAGATWKYLDLGIHPNVAWRTNTFDDSGWKTGRARFGYGDPGMTTTVGFGPNAGSKHITTYFRTRFQVADAAAVTEFTARLLRDDGAVIYVNGVEAARSNMPETTISGTTLAISAVGGEDETTFFVLPLDSGLLRDGENVVAVQIHQANPDSSDLAFDLELTAKALPPNTPPTANAGSDITATVGDGVTLKGSFTDDGLPVPPGVPTFSWSRVSGPGDVSWSDPALPETRAQFATPGVYTLRLTVHDGAASASDDVQVTVTPGATAPVVEMIPGPEPGFRFTAAAGQSYTVLARPSLLEGAWERLRDVPAAAANTTVDVRFDTAAPAGFYLVVTPAMP